MGRLRGRAEPEDREPPVSAQESHLEPRLMDQARPFLFPSQVDLVRRTTSEPLVGPLSVEPFCVEPQLPLDGRDRAVEEEPPGELALHRPPESLDSRDRVRPAHGSESSADAPPPEVISESSRGELRSLVGDDPLRLPAVGDRLAHQPDGE